MEKDNKGITLIMLIITIIIMLILIAVGVDIAIDGKLIDAAEKTVDKTNEKVGQTQDRVDELTGELDKVMQGQCSHEWGEWIITKPATCTEAGIKTSKCNKCGKTKTETIPARHEFENGECINCGEKLVIGAPIDYHEYIGADGNTLTTMPSYSSPKAKTGHDNDQVFTVANNSGIEWIVLGEENGQIKITIKSVVSLSLAYSLEGQAGYTNFIDELNEICAIYGKGRYADTSKFRVTEGGATGGRSFIMEDLGYNKLTRTAGKVYAKEDHGAGAKIWQYPAGSTPDGKSTTGGTQTTFKYMNLDASTSTTEGEHEWSELTNVGDYVEIKNYTYSGSKTLPTGVSFADTYYWLASRYVELDSDYMFGGGRAVDDHNGDSFCAWDMAGSLGDTYGDTNSVRPVVYLSSDISLDYDSSSGYTIHP